MCSGMSREEDFLRMEKGYDLEKYDPAKPYNRSLKDSLVTPGDSISGTQHVRHCAIVTNFGIPTTSFSDLFLLRQARDYQEEALYAFQTAGIFL